jgi:hypothetical protein
MPPTYACPSPLLYPDQIQPDKCLLLLLLLLLTTLLLVSDRPT